MEPSCESEILLETDVISHVVIFSWVHTVMQIKDSTEDSQVPVIICTNQILR